MDTVDIALVDMQASYDLVWAFRSVMEPYWKTPAPEDCFRYAFTEAGEAMDAYLRWKRPTDSRNNYRSPDIIDELADAAIMLLSAHPGLGPKKEFYNASNALDRNNGLGSFLDAICERIGKCLVLGGIVPYYVLYDLFMEFPSINGTIIKRLKSIYLKHHPNPTIREWEQITGDPSERPVHLSEILPQQREAMDGMLP